MKSAILAILAKYAYAADGSMEAAAATQPVAVALATGIDAGSPASPSFLEASHLLTASIADATGNFTMNGGWASNYVDDIEILMGEDAYDSLALTAKYDIIISAADQMSELLGVDVECNGDELRDGSCEITEELFHSIGTFVVNCAGTYAHGNAQSLHNNIDAEPLARYSGTLQAGGSGLSAEKTGSVPAGAGFTSGVLAAPMVTGTYVFTDTSTGYSDACAFTLDYAFDVTVKARIFEAGVQIGHDLERTLTVDVDYEFGGYEMTPGYDGVMQQVIAGTVDATVNAGTVNTEYMDAEVQNEVGVGNVELICQAVLDKRGRTSHLDAVWVYEMTVNGCLRSGAAGEGTQTVNDDEVTISPRLQGEDAALNGLLSSTCLGKITLNALSPVLASSDTDCVLAWDAVNLGCTGDRGEDDTACVHWSAPGADPISGLTQLVAASPGPATLAIAVARYDEDDAVADASDGNEFKLWFYVRLSDASYGNKTASLTVRLPLEASTA